MFQAVRNTFIAATAALALGLFSGAAQAATMPIPIANGDEISPISTTNVYRHYSELSGTGGPGSISFKFIADASQLPLSLFAASTNLTFDNAVITGLRLSLSDGMNTVFQALNVLDLGNGATAISGSIIDSFTSPDGLEKTLTLSWDSYQTGPKGDVIQINIQVAAVPLPAGGLLLIGAIGGLAALRRRKALAA